MCDPGLCFMVDDYDFIRQGIKYEFEYLKKKKLQPKKLWMFKRYIIQE